MEWEVSDLLNNANTHLDRNPPDDDNIRYMVRQLFNTWQPCEDDDDEQPPDPHDIINWAAQKFNIDLNTFSFDDLRQKRNTRIYQLLYLNAFVTNSPDLKDDMEIKDMILRCSNSIKGVYDCLWNSGLLFCRIDPGRNNVVPPEADVEQFLQHNVDKMTNQQKLILHLTKILEAAEYRKVEDQCWQQIYNDQGQATHAWTPVRNENGEIIDLKQYIFTVVQKETDFEYWQYLTNPLDNADKIVKHLIESKHANFATLRVDRYKWSYSNGIYDAKIDMFWKFGEEHLWKEQSDAIQTYRRNNGWESDYTVTHPTGEYMTVKYLNQPFRFTINPETEALFNPDLIKLPAFDKVLDSQKLENETKKWVLRMLARLFFKVGEKDKWQVVFFIKGVAGSGKSTLAKLIRFLYHPSQISTLSSNIEPKFGLSAIYKGLICICAEVREQFGLDQAEWQSAASGEEIQIAIKNKTAISHLWDTPFFFLGNEVPNYKNASGSVDRRIFMIEFNHKVRGSDPKLFDKITQDIDLFQRKAVCLYLHAIRAHGDKDIWCQSPCILPQQIYDFKNNMRSSVDSLYNFMSGSCFEYDDAYEITVKTFKELYMAHRRANNEERCKWNREHYASTFEDLGVSIIVKTGVDENGRQYSGQWLIGVRQSNIAIDVTNDDA